jgi:hypothetical protein
MGLIKKTLILCVAILALVTAARAFVHYSRQGYYAGSREAGWDAYDNNHGRHVATWWHRHYIECFYTTREECAVMNALWLPPDANYDKSNWHDAYGWHQNNPDFSYANHPYWISWESNWRDQDGAQHDWHYSQWRYNRNPNWVTISHPNSISEHPNWVNRSEPLDHRALTHAENEGNQRIPQQQVSLQQNQVNQQNPAQKAAVICVFLLALRSGLNP